MPTFHILDAIAQDIELGMETETTREMIPRNTGNLSDDEEVRTKRKKNSDEDTPIDPAKLRMTIYLFGKTADGTALRASV